MIEDPFQRLDLDREVLSVSQLNQRARLLLEDVFPRVWVEGEISNLARPASGHLYFTLKDAQAQVRCALFRQNALRLRQTIQNGLAVRVRGKVSLFEGRGDYQMVIDLLEPAGEGALRLAFEALKQKLNAEGLFDVERKKALPKHPRRVAIVTSPTGAVIRDIISIFARRAPQIELFVVPTTVQGREGCGQIIRALQLADRQGYDAVILARGGGSLEDLWCFNEEALARAIIACHTPIISAIGHETDVSISDFAADVRAPTPSAAAELLAPDQSDLQRRVDELTRRLQARMEERLKLERVHLQHLFNRLRHPGERVRQQAQRVDDLELRLGYAMTRRLHKHRETLTRMEHRILVQHPGHSLSRLRQTLEHLENRLQRATEGTIQTSRQRLQSLMQALHIVSPLATLGRGYSILFDDDDKIIRQATQTQPGQHLTARLSDGQLDVRVEEAQPTPTILPLFD